MSQGPYYLGVDPAKHKATFCLLDAQGKIVTPPFDASADRPGFDLVSSTLSAVLHAEDHLFVGVESTAALDDNWLAYFHALNAHCQVSVLRLDPAQVKAFSGAKPVRAKTDRADARRIAGFVRQYAGELPRFEHNPQYDAMLIVLSEREGIVAELTRLKNRLRDRLVLTFPELPALIGNPYAPRALALLEHMPTAAAMARHHVATIARIKGPGKGAHQIGEPLAAKLREAAKTSVASQQGAMIEAVMRRLARAIQFQSDQLKECNAVVDDYVARGRGDTAPAPPEGESPAPTIERQCALLATLPGVGNVVATTVVLRSRGLSRFRNAKALSAQLAAHPMRTQTGTSKDSAALARRGDRRARPSLFLACMIATHRDKAFAFHKWHHEASGQTPKQAICSVMNRMARLMWTLVRDNKPYDQTIMVANIERHHPAAWQKFLLHWEKKKATPPSEAQDENTQTDP